MISSSVASSLPGSARSASSIASGSVIAPPPSSTSRFSRMMVMRCASVIAVSMARCNSALVAVISAWIAALAVGSTKPGSPSAFVSSAKRLLSPLMASR